METKSVVVFQDAHKELNSRAFGWALNGLSLKPGDKLTLVAILHQVYTPMGYKSIVDNSSLVGANQRIVEGQAAMKKEEYLNNDELAQIAKLYESKEVGFKIVLVTGSSPKEVALKAATNLKATWMVLDRQMKKDEKFFLQKFSCGISRLKRNNRIVHLRGLLDLAIEIQCNSHETYESLLENSYEDYLFSIDVYHKNLLEHLNITANNNLMTSQTKVDELSLIQSRLHEEACSTFTINSNQTTGQTNPDHPSMDEKDLNSIQMISQIKRDQQCQDQEQIKSRPNDEEKDATLVINNDQTTNQKIFDQPSQDEEKTQNFFHDEGWGLRHPTNSEQMIDQTKDDLLSQNQEQIQSIPHRDLLDGKQEKSILENSICFVCKTRRPNIEWQKEFTYKELQDATDGFSVKNCLSEAGYLSTFRGQLEGKLKVVVKKHEITNSQVGEKVKSGVQSILKARHKNVVMMLGSYTEESFLLTIYEYACNGSLDKYLSKESYRLLNWRERVKVAIGVSRGLKYLHENKIIHGNIKPSNILLTHDFKPLLGDFGFGEKLELKMSYKNKNIGNFGYTAPEYQERGKLSTKTDVYSFGVVLLELITGQKATDKISGEKSLVGWAKPLLKGKKYPQLVDPLIRNSYEEDQLLWLVQVIEQCLKKNPKERLSMNMVVSALQGIADSEQCYMTEDFFPAISYSRFLPNINRSQGQTDADQWSQEQEQIDSNSNGEEKSLRLTAENNHIHMIGQRKSDQLSQVEEYMQSRPEGEERSSGKMINNNHSMDQTLVDQLSEFEEQMKSTLYGESISTQKTSNIDIIDQTKADKVSQDQEEQKNFVRKNIGLRSAPISEMIDQTKADHLIQDKAQIKSNSQENLLDGNQGEIILENSKSFACSICKSKRPNIAWQKDFTYEELLVAIDGFSIKNSLSEGGDGPAFKGLLECKQKIFVKKYQITRSQEENIFKSEVQLLTKARHKNVIMMLGLCTYKSQLMIVYEQACNGSLDQYLSRGNFQPLTWRERVKVAIGTARGLKYLHENSIIHGSIKPSNILLNHDFEPLLGDFGFGKGKLEPKSYKDKNKGNSAYTAPEYLESGKLSSRTDVYSFGVVLLELITGRRAMDKLSGGKSLVGWAKPLLGGKKYLQLVDLKINDSYEEEQLQWLVQVTEQCLRKSPKERLTMNMAVSALQGIEDTNKCCIIEDSSPKRSSLLHSEPAMTSSQGQIKADQVNQEQERIETNPYGEEMSLRFGTKNNHMIGQTKPDQLSQVGEQMQSRLHREERMSRVAIINNHMIDQINPDQLSHEQEHMKGSFQIEEIGKKEVDKKQKVRQDKKQMQGSSNANLLDVYKGKIILENSKSSVCSICKCRRPNTGWQKKFTHEELQAATEGFSIKNSLSEGEYGPAFRGQLDNKLKIVVKEHQITSSQAEKMFKSKVQLLTNARHENVVMLLGSCIRESQLLIVYEHACNGSLDQQLSRASGKSLTWRERVKVAIGVSRGLKYLHENNIIHGRIKSSNILLNHEFEPLLGDFVFGKERHELKNSCKDKNIGKCEYTAPECQESGKLSTKADVYSFGAVLLELITGCMIINEISGHKCLIEWARPLLEGRKYPQLTDPKISSSCDEQELVSLVQVTEKCLRKNPKERLTMNMVVSALLCMVDSNDSYVTEDSSSAKSYVACSVADVTSSKGEEESLVEKDLGTDFSQEIEDNITCRSNSETETSQESDSCITCGESLNEIQEKESLSTKVYQKSESCISYYGARNFFLGGAKEYTVCEQFFRLCNSS